MIPIICPINGTVGLIRGGSFGSIVGVNTLFSSGKITALAKIVARIVSVVFELWPSRSAIMPCDGKLPL